MLLTLDPQSMKPTLLSFSLLHLLPFLFSYHPLTPSLIHLTFLSMILSPDSIFLFLQLSTFMCIDICVHMCILKCTCTHGHTHTLCSNKRFPEQRLISCSYLLNVGHGLVMAVLHVSSLWDPGHRVAPIWVTDVPIADRRQTIELSCYGSESFCLEMA